MSFLSKYTSQIPEDKKKFLVYGLAVMIFVIFISFIIWINTAFSNTPEPTPTSNPNPTPVVQEPDPSNTFDSNEAYQQVFNQEIVASSQLLQTEKDIYSFSNNYKLQKNGIEFTKSPKVFPLSIYTDPQENIIINEEYGVNLYNQKDFSFSSAIRSLTPIESGDFKYTYIKITESKTELVVSKNLPTEFTKTSSQTGDLIIDISRFKDKYIRLFNAQDRVYLFVFSDPSMRGSGDILSLDRNTRQTTLLYSFKDLFQLNFQKRGVFFTRKVTLENQTDEYNTSYLNLYQNAKGVIYPLALRERLLEMDILGNILASRCSEKEAEIFCLVKKLNVNRFNSSPDQIVKYLPSQDKIEIPYPNLNIQAQTLHTQEDILFIRQNPSLVYRIEL